MDVNKFLEENPHVKEAYITEGGEIYTSKHEHEKDYYAFLDMMTVKGREVPNPKYKIVKTVTRPVDAPATDIDAVVEEDASEVADETE